MKFPALAAALVVALLAHPLLAEAGGEFSFIRPSVLRRLTIPTGDDTFSNEIPVLGGFRFGNSSVRSVYVSTNGYISMGLTPTANAQNIAGSNSVVAPYGADIDTRVAGTVTYTHFYSHETQLEAVSEFIEDQMGVRFRGVRMMVAEWDGVAQYQGNPSVTSTFQAVLITGAVLSTDGKASYAVFIYKCGGMGWGGAEIGWQSSKSDADEHELSGDRSAEIGCRYSTSSSAVVFRLESCSRNQFRCDGGRCLDDSRVCNGKTDCDDGSDEEQDCLDITLIASGAAFGFALLLFIVVAVCIFLYCLARNKKRKPVVRRTNRSAIGLETTPTDSDITGQTSIDPVPSLSTQETSFTNPTLYPKLPDEKGAELDSKEPPPPTYNECASLSPAPPVATENDYQGYPAPTYPVASHPQQEKSQPQPSAPPPPPPPSIQEL